MTFNNNFNYIHFWFNITPLYLAVSKENIEIIKLLISKDMLDINIPYIYIDFIYEIQNSIFKSHS